MASARPVLTLIVAGGSMLGSLYFSEKAGYIPCRLCWFQRIAMYPIALVALVALIRRDRGARWYIVPMATIGALISTWHYLVEWNPTWEGTSCSLFGPACSDIWFRTWGFSTLAFMALCGFVSIIVFNTVTLPPDRRTGAIVRSRPARLAGVIVVVVSPSPGVAATTTTHSGSTARVGCESPPRRRHDRRSGARRRRRAERHGVTGPA